MWEGVELSLYFVQTSMFSTRIMYAGKSRWSTIIGTNTGGTGLTTLNEDKDYNFTLLLFSNFLISRSLVKIITMHIRCLAKCVHGAKLYPDPPFLTAKPTFSISSFDWCAVCHQTRTFWYSIWTHKMSQILHVAKDWTAQKQNWNIKIIQNLSHQ